MIQIRSLLTEAELAEEFFASIAARRLPEKFFYWLPLSVRAWLALCSDGAYRNYVRSASLIARSAAELARLLAPGPVEVVSLGAGQGDKDLLLLSALRDAGAEPSYTPVDASISLLEMAVAAANAAGFPAGGIKADFTDPAHLAAVAGATPSRRLWMMLGNTLGSMDPLAASKELSGLLGPGDLLLVDGEIHAGDTTLAGYDNPINRAFAWAPLTSIGIGEADGRLSFSLAGDGRRPGLYLVAKQFQATRDVAATLAGETVSLKEQETVLMSHSYKYEAEAFRQILAEADLEPLWEGTGEDGRFLMSLHRPVESERKQSP